ncbi:SAM-dependent methyltransferase, partial [Lacticaseibacillus paracasei]
MRKRETKIHLAAAQAPLFACPVCGQPLQVTAGSLVCVNGHVRDFSHKGTLNFLN